MTERVADPELEAWLRQAPPFAEPDAAALRAGVADRSRGRSREPAVDHVTDLGAGGVPARLYVPRAATAAPLLVHLHGGGWTIAGLDSHDRLCRRLADGAGIRVLAVDYRLAPEHPWPAAVDDAVAVLRWVAAGAAPLGPPPPAVAVGGDSAGGTLAALACLRLRDEAPAALPDLQVLMCANTDLTGAAPSIREKGEGWGLDAAMIRWFNRQWVPDENRWGDPDVSPLHAPDLAGLPAALVITAEHDALRDEGEAYGRRLADAGVRVTSRREPGLVHNFVMLADVSPACRAATERFIIDVRGQLRGR